jgi:DNA-binding CsgD family transcriptional regulator
MKLLGREELAREFVPVWNANPSGVTHMRSWFERERAQREAAATAAECLRVDELGRDPLSWLARAVDASSVLLYRYEQEGMVAGRGGNLLSALPAYYGELFAEDPLQQALFTLEKTPPVVHAKQIAGFDEPAYRRSAAYNEFYLQHEMEHLLGSGLTNTRYGSAGMTGILFCRSKREQPFCERDHAMVLGAVAAFQAAVRRHDRLLREEKPGVNAEPATASRDDWHANQLVLLAREHGLTSAECEVLALLAEGLSNREIAQRRFVSLETIRTHVQRVLSKLDVRTRTQAALYVERRLVKV